MGWKIKVFLSCMHVSDGGCYRYVKALMKIDGQDFWAWGWGGVEITGADVGT